VSPTNPPGAPRDNPDGGRDDWQRRQRATVRRSRRAGQPGQPPSDTDPYGWGAARDEAETHGPAEYRGGTPRGGRPEPGDGGWGEPGRGAVRGEGRPGHRPEGGDPRLWAGDPARDRGPGGNPLRAEPGRRDPNGAETSWATGSRMAGAPGGRGAADQRPIDPRQVDPRQVDPRLADPRLADPRLAEPPPGPPRAAEPRQMSSRDWLRPDEALREAGRRLRGPHRRRAVEGQLTGLDPNLQSDLPSWLQQRGEEQVPVQRLLSLSVAVFAALLGLALNLGAYALPGSYALVILGVQVLFILSWTATLRPAGPRVVAAVALIAAVAADLAAVLPTHASLAPVGLVTAGAFGVAVVGQLMRGGDRSKVTESLGGTLILVVGVVCFSMLVVLIRHSPGTPAVVACLVAAGVALVVARLTDIVLPSPRTSPQVPRGSIGVILGAMAGTVAAGYMGSVLAGLHPPRAALAGLVTALVAVLADLAVSYAEAGRALAGEPSPLWIARHMQGPLGGFALAAPVAYVLSVMVLVTNL